MFRFAVILYFFVHLAVMIKHPRWTWASRVVGYGISLFFIGLVIFSVEPNSNIVFIITALLSAIAVFAAEIVAKIIQKQDCLIDLTKDF